MASECLGCGGKRDRGPYTKYCSNCFIKPCRRCGQPNTRGPYTVLCSNCKNAPPIEDRSICSRCGRANDRGRRTKICSICLEADSTLAKKETAKLRKLEAPAGKSWCSTCEQYLEHSEFYSKNESTCIPCRAKGARNRSLNNSYGITEEQYLAIFIAQGKKCAICGNTPKRQRFHVDHDHKTGLVRGILCMWCNHKLLGGARDNIEYLERAISYLQSPPAVMVIGEQFGKAKRD